MFGPAVGDGGTGVFLVTVTVMAVRCASPAFEASADMRGGATDSAGRVDSLGFTECGSV